MAAVPLAQLGTIASATGEAGAGAGGTTRRRALERGAKTSCHADFVNQPPTTTPWDPVYLD